MTGDTKTRAAPYASATGLGEQSDYSADYDPAILDPIPRLAYRETLEHPQYAEATAMAGLDAWQCFELSWLNDKGKPQFSLGQFSIDTHSPNIVESKSLKLYLNSLNQKPFASAEALQETVGRDVGAACGADVALRLFAPEAIVNADADLAAQYGKPTLIDAIDVTCESYQRNAELLAFVDGQANAQTEGEWLHSRLLRSNCPVTAQPDWAQLDICYAGRQLDRGALLQYIASYREHCGFHEQTVEQIYCDIAAFGKSEIEELAVLARYTRRGGIAINVLRAMPGCENTLRARAASVAPGQ